METKNVQLSLEMAKKWFEGNNAFTIMDYDQYKEGLFDPYSPINEKEVENEKPRLFENLSDAYENGDAEEFTNFQAELLERLEQLRYVLDTLESGLKRRVEQLIEKTK
jgi:hypothetical protein